MSVCEENMKRVRRPDTKGSGRSEENLEHHTQEGAERILHITRRMELFFSRWEWGALRLHRAFQHAVPTTWTPS